MSDKKKSNFVINECVMVRNLSELIRWDTLDGKKRLVIPVVLMVEGVHNNVLYSGEELGTFAEAWNGEPVCVNHPQDAKGNFVSCNSPEMIEAVTIGQLFHSKFEDNKLKSEAWIDVDKANEVDESIMQILQSNTQLEVSLAAFIEEIKQEGEFDGEEFKGIATNLRPDHLAFLPNDEGACSIKDGAGAPRVNKKELGNAMSKNKKKDEQEEGKPTRLLDSNELAHESIRDELRRQLSEPERMASFGSRTCSIRVWYLK